MDRFGIHFGTIFGRVQRYLGAIASLPAAMRQRLADLLNECQAQGKWPTCWQLVLICLLPKADGGRRPIGLFPAVIRLWMRARASKLRDWERLHDHPALYGSTGKAATRATWVSAWEAEAAKDRGALFAQALLDLAKAFEISGLAAYIKGLCLPFGISRGSSWLFWDV